MPTTPAIWYDRKRPWPTSHPTQEATGIFSRCSRQEFEGAVGHGGTILHSTDGTTWQPQASGTKNDLYSVYGTSDAKTLWAVGHGGTILHSTDGTTWLSQASGTIDRQNHTCFHRQNFQSPSALRNAVVGVPLRDQQPMPKAVLTVVLFGFKGTARLIRGVRGGQD
jgi:hypothetical protein